MKSVPGKIDPWDFSQITDSSNAKNLALIFLNIGINVFFFFFNMVAGVLMTMAGISASYLFGTGKCLVFLSLCVSAVFTLLYLGISMIG